MRIEETGIDHCVCLRAAAGTTGFCGGDSGHGGRTHIEIENCNSGDIEFIVEQGANGDKLTIELGGDSELYTMVLMLKFIVHTIEHQVGQSHFRPPVYEEWQD